LIIQRNCLTCKHTQFKMSYSIFDVLSVLASAETLTIDPNDITWKYYLFTLDYYKKTILSDLLNEFHVYCTEYPHSDLVTRFILASNWSEVLRAILTLNVTENDDPATREMKIRLMISISYHLSMMVKDIGTDNTIRMFQRIEDIEKNEYNM